MNTTDREILVLAALLNDIGRFVQSAGSPKSDQLEADRARAGVMGRSTHLHVSNRSFHRE
jgi:predicted HD phosphohydrolase